jgi:hypothetical protein
MATLSPMGQALGLNLGNSEPLQQQVKNETAEERKKRLILQQQKLAVGPAAMSLGLGIRWAKRCAH